MIILTVYKLENMKLCRFKAVKPFIWLTSSFISQKMEVFNWFDLCILSFITIYPLLYQSVSVLYVCMHCIKLLPVHKQVVSQPCYIQIIEHYKKQWCPHFFISSCLHFFSPGFLCPLHPGDQQPAASHHQTCNWCLTLLYNIRGYIHALFRKWLSTSNKQCLTQV